MLCAGQIKQIAGRPAGILKKKKQQPLAFKRRMRLVCIRGADLGHVGLFFHMTTLLPFSEQPLVLYHTPMPCTCPFRDQSPQGKEIYSAALGFFRMLVSQVLLRKLQELNLGRLMGIFSCLAGQTQISLQCLEEGYKLLGSDLS